MSEVKVWSSNSIGLPGILGIVFIVLKLTHVIDWSWWWVLAPFWVVSAFFIFLLVIALFVSALAAARKR
jgi:phosphoglycerol transferase MdoB-like AlkP superfamily enzyme